MRNLATIQKVMRVYPIPGADMIEAVDILGWTVVSQKGIHTAGDLVVYYEVDSFLNANDLRYASFEERFGNWGDKRGMRLKTIKLRKQISQGLILATKNFPEIKSPKEGDDVTELLKIEKWESLSESQSNSGGNVARAQGSRQFPTFIFKTDQERVQNQINRMSLVMEETFEATIKLDGSSMTVFYLSPGSKYYDDAVLEIENRMLKRKSWFSKLIYKLRKKLGMIPQVEYIEGVCSRNIQLAPEGDNHFSSYVREHDILASLNALGRSIAIQGELVGKAIQNNYEKVADNNEFYVFDVFDIENQKYLLPVESRSIVKTLGLSYVPVLDETMSLKTFSAKVVSDDPAENSRAIVDNILKFAEGPGLRKDVKREGVVFKSNSSNFSMKAISNSYLLKKDKA